MARFFRKDFDVFPRIDLVSVVFGGYCGYVIGEWSGKSRMRELIKNERIADRILKKAYEAERKLMINEEKRDELIRDVKSMIQRFSEKERELQNLEKQLKERERKVEMAEKKKPTIKAMLTIR